MLMIRRSADRGQVDTGWLNSRHSFSFGQYQDPQHMGFGPLRVINEDRVKPDSGFAEHGHANMEIISYVLSGELAHKDSLGSGSTIRPGDVQRMSAGRGIRHSEFNASKEKEVHFLQIWLEPDTYDILPGYEQRAFGDTRKGILKLVASKAGREGSLTLHQDADLYAAILSAGDTVQHRLADGRNGWLQVARGGVDLNGERLEAGDGAGMDAIDSITVTALENSEILFFDLP